MTRTSTILRFGLLLTLVFTGGAVIGPFAARAWTVHAIWIPAAVLFVTLILFVVDERKGIEP